MSWFSPFHRRMYVRSQWVEIFEGLGHQVFGALCYPESVDSALEVLTSFVRGSQLRDAALRYASLPRQRRQIGTWYVCTLSLIHI